MELGLAGIKLKAHSVGGVETCIQLPELQLCLDIGRCPRGAESIGQLLLTHAHIDHAAGLPYYVSLRSMNGMKPPHVYAPKGSIPALEEILQAWTKLQADTDRLHLHPVSPKQIIHLKKGLEAEVFPAPHRIGAVGYAIYQKKRKLLEKYLGLDNSEIVALKQRGEQIVEERRELLLAFSGDARIEVLDNEPSLYQAKLLILECTFLGEKQSIEWAAKSGHIHLDQIAERAHLFENEALLLTHFSRRYSPEQIRETVKKKLPDSLWQRTTLLIPPH